VKRFEEQISVEGQSYRCIGTCSMRGCEPFLYTLEVYHPFRAGGQDLVAELGEDELTEIELELEDLLALRQTDEAMRQAGACTT
jgi:hypothetical protein